MSTLAAARADNFYYPPEWTPKKGGLNKFQGQHALRERAKKIDQGILVIRFEMPFHIWCGGCKAMIAKGVRFNAEKKQVGNYFSTKIWSFKMTSPCCQHEIEIQTDPKNCDYVVVSGAEKKVEEFTPEDAETLALPDPEEREKLQDPFFKLEHGNADVAVGKSSEPIINRLKKMSDAKHSDPYLRNRALRGEMRAQKKRVASEEAEARSRGLGIRLLPPSAEDSEIASNTNFKRKFDQNLKDKRARIQASSIFSTSMLSSPSKKTVGKNVTSSISSQIFTGKNGKTEILNGDRKLELLAKKRKIDAKGALGLISGNFRLSAKSRFQEQNLSESTSSILVSKKNLST